MWRLCLVAASASLLAALSHWIFGHGSIAGIWLLAIITGLGWLATVRMLLLDTRLRIAWIVWLVFGLLTLAVAHSVGMASFTSLTFLLFRRYQPLRQLSSIRRAKLFGLAFLCTPLLIAGVSTGESQGALAILGNEVTRYAVLSLAAFWIMTILQLAFRARLHFLRLKPKLAIAVLLIAFVPLVLVVTLGFLVGYGALGGRSADRGGAILKDWARLVDQHPENGALLFGPGFTDPPAAGQEVPWWTKQFREALAKTPSSTAWAPSDTTAFFVLGKEMWLLRIRGIRAESSPRLQGWPVRQELMDHLSALLHANSRLALKLETAGAFFGKSNVAAGDWVVDGHYYAVVDSSKSVFERPLYFGGTQIQAIELANDKLKQDSVLLTFSVSPAELARDFVSGNNEVSQGLVLLLAILAALFLFVELASLFFGLRISTGITSAVKALHRGTEELARGNLDTHISVPNEDEFGDLARSFNEMTLAVKQGQHELLERERLQRELETAREIQQRLLPSAVPQLPGFSIAGISEPSRQVGGDYYDFLRLPNSNLGIAVGDVSGKGIPAALLMSNLQASLKGQILHGGSVSRTVALVNQLLVSSTDTNMFATFFYGELDPRAGTFTSSNAGHDPPILCRADGSIERLSTGGLILGIMDETKYEESTLRMNEGDVLVVYTDGITEAQGPLPQLPSSKQGNSAPAARGVLGAAERAQGGELASGASEVQDDRVNLFEEERLIDVILANRGRSAQEIEHAILDAVKRHVGNIPQSDDITLVVIKRDSHHS